MQFIHLHAYIAYSTPWVIDSVIFTHITCIKDKFDFLEFSNKYSLVYIVDGPSSVVGDEVVLAIPLLTLKNVIFVPKFPVNLLSTSLLTLKNVTFPFLIVSSRPSNWNED